MPFQEIRCALPVCNTLRGYTRAKKVPKVYCQVAHAQVAEQSKNARRDETVKELRDGGLPVTKIAATIGVSRQRVYQILNRLESEHSDT